MGMSSPPCSETFRLALLDVIDALADAGTLADFLATVDGPLRRVLPHDGMVCGMADSIAEWNPHCLLLHRFPPEYMAAIRKPGGGYDSEMIRQWQATRVPVLADPALPEGRWWSDGWMERAHAAGLTNLIGHGFVDMKGEAVSYFCFIRIAEPLRDRHVYVLNRLLPHLHMALLHAIGNAPDGFQMRPDVIAEADPRSRHAPCPGPGGVELSPRQIETLAWLKLGKTNGEIAVILGTSEANVKYHVKVIFGKLDVYSRTQAVAKALELGIIR